MKPGTIVRWLCLLGLTYLAWAACSRPAVRSAAMDRLIRTDPGRWAKIIEPRIALYEKELRRLNPLYDSAARESITQPLEKVILSLFAIQKKDGVIVELGSWTGGGVLLMAPFLTHADSYHAVDTFNADHMPDAFVQSYLKGRKHLDVFRGNIRPVRNKVVIHQGTTDEVAAKWPRDQAIDFLFIDADHTYEAVSADWKNWSPFVRAGGIIAFHDYYVKTEGGHVGVRRFVDEAIAGRPGFHYVEGLAWYVVE